MNINKYIYYQKFTFNFNTFILDAFIGARAIRIKIAFLNKEPILFKICKFCYNQNLFVNHDLECQTIKSSSMIYY